MEDTIQDIKKGDRKAFHDFYYSHHARLYHYIYKFTRSQWIAEETVQLSFVKLWETRETLSISHSLSIQLFRIAKSILIDLLRKNAIRKTSCLHGNGVENISLAVNYDTYEIKDDLQHTLDRIRKMPPVQQKVFSYSRLDDFSHKEIADKLSISPKTVETHITRAIKQLKKVVQLLFF